MGVRRTPSNDLRPWSGPSHPCREGRSGQSGECRGEPLERWVRAGRPGCVEGSEQLLLARYALATQLTQRPRIVLLRHKDVASRIPIDRDGLRDRVTDTLLAGDVNEDYALGDLGRPSVGI